MPLTQFLPCPSGSEMGEKELLPQYADDRRGTVALVAGFLFHLIFPRIPMGERKTHYVIKNISPLRAELRHLF